MRIFRGTTANKSLQAAKFMIQNKRTHFKIIFQEFSREEQNESWGEKGWGRQAKRPG